MSTPGAQKVWVVELKVARRSNKIKATRSIPLSYTEAKAEIERFEKLGLEARMISIPPPLEVLMPVRRPRVAQATPAKARQGTLPGVG